MKKLKNPQLQCVCMWEQDMIRWSFKELLTSVNTCFLWAQRNTQKRMSILISFPKTREVRMHTRITQIQCILLKSKTKLLLKHWIDLVSFSSVLCSIKTVLIEKLKPLNQNIRNHFKMTLGRWCSLLPMKLTRKRPSIDWLVAISRLWIKKETETSYSNSIQDITVQTSWVLLFIQNLN